MRRLAGVLVVLSVVLVAAPARAETWQQRVDNMVRGKRFSVVIRDNGRTLYTYQPRIERAPASNEKLLMSMALFEQVGPDHTMTTTVLSAPRLGNVVWGDLWLVGRGDPTISAKSSFARYFGDDATRIEHIADQIAATGIIRVRGSVVGSTGYFARDWFAPGWKRDFPSEEVALPTALTFQGNVHKGRHVSKPELYAARALTLALRDRGVAVDEPPGFGRTPSGASMLTTIESEPIATHASYMNKASNNFIAEVFGKLLGAKRFGAPGTIDKGARAIESFAAEHNVRLTAYDSSGLSYANRVTAMGMARLLGRVEHEEWGEALRSTLAAGGQGTLEDRLHDVAVRAKTGTLEFVSALSGWVWLQKDGSWAEFSILSRGMSKSVASNIEDAIVRTVSRRASAMGSQKVSTEVASGLAMGVAGLLG
jgi:serine-type D-Ala-D-Ala carboxypeptidase/endopeptidase (penicillin-binding protein 4)